MKKHGNNRDKDGTGRVPAGNRKVRALKDRVPFDTFVQALGWVYHHLRLRCGQTLRDLAARARVGVQTICEMESGRHPPRLDVETRVANALGYHTEHVHRLTRRWMRKLIRRNRCRLLAVAARVAALLAPFLDDAFDWLAA